MLSDQASQSAIQTYSEFLRKYFPRHARELESLEAKKPYELGADAARRSLEEIGLGHSSNCLAKLKSASS